jgi:thiol-disulfide isomerase/thioredoxin
MTRLRTARASSPALLCIIWLASACLVVPPTLADEIQDYLTGEMASLQLLDPPVSLAAHRIIYPDGSEHPLEEKSGMVLLVNLWARGCVPCRDEMPDLAALQRDLGDDQFEVMALPMDKKSAKSASKILSSWKAENLEPYGHDIEALARLLYDEGFYTETEVSFVYPTTYLVNKTGEILAMREGFLRWDSPEARALISALKNDDID